MDTYKGAIRSDDGTSWYLTNDDVKLLNADPEHVLWVSTREELTLELHDRNPCEFEGLSFVYDGGYNGVNVYDIPVTLAKEAKEVAAAARLAGAVRTPNAHFSNHDFVDCVVIRPFLAATLSSQVVTYNPKKAKAWHQRRKLREDKSHVTVGDVCRVLQQLENVTDPPFPRPGTYGASSRDCYVAFLAGRLVLFNLLYGRRAHRKFGPWQDFVRLWKQKREVTEKTFLASGLKKFVEFMGRECDRRMRKPVEFKKAELDEIRLP